jgi:hypothetical protein
MPLPGNDHDHTMQMARDDSDRKSKPRAPLPRTLSRHRHARLRDDAPRHQFRDEFVEPRLDVEVSLVGGANGTLRRLLETEGNQ